MDNLSSEIGKKVPLWTLTYSEWEKKNTTIIAEALPSFSVFAGESKKSNKESERSKNNKTQIANTYLLKIIIHQSVSSS